MRALSRSSAVGLCKAAGLCHGECDGAIALAPARPSRAVDHRPRRRRRVADGAHAFARAAGRPECDPRSLVTERQRTRLAERVATATGARRGASGGTVGATALDRHGTVAAATSTGGTLGKRPGRV